MAYDLVDLPAFLLVAIAHAAPRILTVLQGAFEFGY
jgi:hypothetical protein